MYVQSVLFTSKLLCRSTKLKLYNMLINTCAFESRIMKMQIEEKLLIFEKKFCDKYLV